MYCPQPTVNKECLGKKQYCTVPLTFFQPFCTNDKLFLHILIGNTYNLSILCEDYDFS